MMRVNGFSTEIVLLLQFSPYPDHVISVIWVQARFHLLFEPALRTLLSDGPSSFDGVSRFNPTNAAEACQLATGLNRWKPSLSEVVVTFSACVLHFNVVVLKSYK